MDVINETRVVSSEKSSIQDELDTYLYRTSGSCHTEHVIRDEKTVLNQQ